MSHLIMDKDEHLVVYDAMLPDCTPTPSSSTLTLMAPTNSHGSSFSIPATSKDGMEIVAASPKDSILPTRSTLIISFSDVLAHSVERNVYGPVPAALSLATDILVSVSNGGSGKQELQSNNDDAEKAQQEPAILVTDTDAGNPAAAKMIPFPTPPVEDIDMLGSNNVLTPAHSSFIYAWKFDWQTRTECRITNYFIHNTPVNINLQMRRILIDWLCDVHLQFRLLPETLFDTCSIIDRFLMRAAPDWLPRTKLQLCGIAAMFLASKVQEIYPPERTDFIYICANAYTEAQMAEMELEICQKLGGLFTVPTMLCFMRRFSTVANLDYKLHTLVKYLLELCLLSFNLMVTYLPSELAAGCNLLAHLMAHQVPSWVRYLLVSRSSLIILLILFSPFHMGQVDTCHDALRAHDV